MGLVLELCLWDNFEFFADVPRPSLGIGLAARPSEPEAERLRLAIIEQVRPASTKVPLLGHHTVVIEMKP